MVAVTYELLGSGYFTAQNQHASGFLDILFCKIVAAPESKMPVAKAALERRS
jgi:hypothetical protein